MFAGSTTFFAALTLLCGSALAGPPIQPNMNHICVLLPNGMAVSSGVDCTTFYSCYNGVATLQSCGNSLYFDKDSQQCLPPNQAVCYNQAGGPDNLAEPCYGRQNGTWVPVSGSCSGYYYCGLNGQALQGNCPLGENFSYQSQKCVFNSAMPCTETPINTGTGGSTDGSTVVAINLCDYVENGIYFASPSSCGGWNLCTNNMMQSGTCPSGYVFNAQSQNCDYPSDTNCNQVTNDPELSGASQFGGPCTTSGLLKPASSCAGYYRCDGTNYILMTCTGNTYFDTVTQTCINRLQARNNCDRCAGTNAQFVNAYSKSACTNYLYCVNGVEQGSGTCAAGSYFSETAGACVYGVQPLIGCCNPAAYFTDGGVVPPVETPAVTTEDTPADKPDVPAVPDTKPDVPAVPDTKPDVPGGGN